MALRPYSIRSPEFEVTSGGIRVLYGLYGWLLAKGQLAYLNTKFSDDNFVGIYTDIHKGNDLGAGTVVRYLLNFPGTMGQLNAENGKYEPGQTDFGRDDIIYVFSEVFNTVGVKKDHILFLPILNLHIFKDQKKRRNKKAVFFGKGIRGNLHPDGCITLDRSFAQDQQKLADVLNECEVVYIYDQVTAMYELARLCGCRVVIFPTGITKDQFSKYEPGMNGISWGKDEGIKLDVKGFRSHYKLMKAEFSRKLDIFIERTQR